MLVLSVPMTLFAAEKAGMSDAFRAILNEDGKFVIPSVEPKTEEEILMYVNEYVWQQYNKKGISTNYTTYDPVKKTCDVTYNGETHNVEILFKYDEERNKEAQKLIANFPEEMGTFYVRDMELIHYWLARIGDKNTDEEIRGLHKYSNEIKLLTGTSDFVFFIDNLGESKCEFATARAGMAWLVCDKTAYYTNEYVESIAPHVLYVPTDTGNSKEELMAAVQKRMDEYIGKDRIKISFGGNGVSQILTQEDKRYLKETAAGDYWFVATIKDVNYKFIIVKDSSKFTVPKVRITHTYPKTMKVGEVFKEEYYVNVFGLDPNEWGVCGGASGFPIYRNGYWHLGGYGGGAMYNADENGRILKEFNSDWMTYKPGEVSVEVKFSCYADEFDRYETRKYIAATIIVEEPIITHNAPKKVKVGDTVDFKTAITNTAYENKKQSDYYHLWSPVFYVPSVQVIEGEGLVEQGAQDYTNTLQTLEKLSFTGSGTVKLKISYMPTVYKVYGPDEIKDGKPEPLTDGVVEEVVTIVVEDDKPEVSVPEDLEDDELEDDTSTTEPETSETPSTEPESPIEQEPETEGQPETEQTPNTEETPSTEEIPGIEDDYVVELDEDKKVISKVEFEVILAENKDKDVVIQSSADIVFTFPQGSMSEVEDMEDYDFGTDIETEFEAKVEYGKKVNESNFVSRINFNYEGMLPGMASIQIHVGMDQKGMTLYYSKLCNDGTIKFIYSAVVDENEYITVKQDSCSDYILTTERVDDKAEKDNVTGQKDNENGVGDVIGVIFVIIAIVAAAVALFFVLKRKGWKLNI